MSLSAGEVFTYATGAGVTFVSLFTLYGKGRENAWAQAEKIRVELQKQIDESRLREKISEKDIQDIQKRVGDLEAELSRVKGDTRTLLEFLHDVTGGSFDLAWIQQRAKDLLGRITQ
jgi:hypothetical protein